MIRYVSREIIEIVPAHSSISEENSFHAGIYDISRISLQKTTRFTKKNKDKKRPVKEDTCVVDTPTLELKVIHYSMKGRKYSAVVQLSSSLGAGDIFGDELDPEESTSTNGENERMTSLSRLLYADTSGSTGTTFVTLLCFEAKFCCRYLPSVLFLVARCWKLTSRSCQNKGIAQLIPVSMTKVCEFDAARAVYL
jgi:hypothetical protein